MEQRSATVPTGIKILVASAIYFFIAAASLRFSFDSTNASPIWPPSGFAFALLLMFGKRMWPGIFLGALSANLFVFLVNNTISPFTAIWTSLTIAGGNSLEAIAGYILIQRLIAPVHPILILDKVKSVIRFFYISALMCIVSCTIGATVILASGIIVPEHFFTVWYTWWVGDVAGILLFTPLIVAWYYRWNDLIKTMYKKNLVITIFIAAGTILTTGLVFLNWFDPEFVFTRSFIIIPFLIIAAVRLPLSLVVTLLLFVAIMTIAGTVEGIGPFVGGNMNESLITAETFIAVNCTMVLVLRAAIAEDEYLKSWLQSAKDQLEIAVHDRTKDLEVKNQELASFNYAASHDLQEPLRKIYTFTDRILEVEKDRLSDRGKEYFKRIQNATDRMKKLIDNLMDYLHVDSKERTTEITDLNLILNQVTRNLHGGETEVNATIDASKLPVIRCVGFQMEQLFTNLLSNSVKFRRRDADLHIIIRSEIVEGKIMKSFIKEPAKKYYHITFQDNGIGFNAAYSVKIFDIFQRLHGYAEYAGSGIGLAICKKIVENHKGYIYASGKEGDGAIFHIYLPVTEEMKEYHNLAASVQQGAYEPDKIFTKRELRF